MRIETISQNPVPAGPAPTSEEAREIRNGTTEEAAAPPSPDRTAERARGLGRTVDTQV